MRDIDAVSSGWIISVDWLSNATSGVARLGIFADCPTTHFLCFLLTTHNDYDCRPSSELDSVAESVADSLLSALPKRPILLPIRKARNGHWQRKKIAASRERKAAIPELVHQFLALLTTHPYVRWFRAQLSSTVVVGRCRWSLSLVVVVRSYV